MTLKRTDTWPRKSPLERRRTCAGVISALALSLFACSDANAPPPSVQPQTPVAYPLDEGAYTLLQAVWEPLVPPDDTYRRIDDGELSVTDLDAYPDAGLGVRLGDGVPWEEHVELAPDFSEGTDRRSLLYVWQAADPQLIDEESPIRFEGFDALYRPQGHLTTQVFESHVRTAQRISDASGRPFEFALMAGDLTDGSQLNELSWFITAMAGGVIDPDSGADDDPVPGDGNDFNDPFISEGLAVPWYAAIGNHETLYNGGFGPISDTIRDAAVSDSIYQFPLFENGFRDGATINANVIVDGTTIADESRLPLRIDEVLALLHEAPGEPAGHGLTADDVAASRGYFSVHPVPNKPIRLITLDTVYSSAMTVGLGSLGYMEVEQHLWLEEQLTEADLADELVVVMSHHRAADIQNDSPVSGVQLQDTLRASRGVVLHVTGHGHANEKTIVPTMDAEGGYWELMLASTVDFPMQSRIFELVDERNGHLSIYVTNIDHNAPVDSLAHRARELAAGKRAFGTVSEDGDVAAFWERDRVEQNLLLRVAIDPDLAESLAMTEWPTRIESLETLAKFTRP